VAFLSSHKVSPYQAEIIKEKFEEKLLLGAPAKEQPKESESTREASEEEVITMHLDVQYENINGQRIMFIKKRAEFVRFTLMTGRNWK